MSEFTKAMQSWIDRDGLVGTSPNPTPWSGGNQILDTSIACIMEVELNGWNSDNLFLVACRDAIARCKNSDGSFDKNPGRIDGFTHDDRLAMCAAARVCGFPFAKDWVDFGLKSGWEMSNTGLLYWDADACTKRWERAAHLVCDSKRPGFVSGILLVFWIIGNALFGDVSAHRLMYTLSRAMNNISFFRNLAFHFWAYKMEKKYENPGNLMSAYLSGSIFSDTHPFVMFGRKIKF